MARFICTTYGRAKTEASRLGDSASGISSHTRGWNLGATAFLFADGELRTPSGKLKDPGRDFLTLQITSGGSGGQVLLDLGEWYRLSDGTLASASPRAELILRAIRNQ